MFEIQRMIVIRPGHIVLYMDDKLCNVCTLKIPLDCGGFLINCKVSIIDENKDISEFLYVERELMDICHTDFDKLEKYEHKIVHSILNNLSTYLNYTCKEILAIADVTRKTYEQICSTISLTWESIKEKQLKNKPVPFWVYKQQLSKPYKRR